MQPATALCLDLLHVTLQCWCSGGNIVQEVIWSFDCTGCNLGRPSGLRHPAPGVAHVSYAIVLGPSRLWCSGGIVIEASCKLFLRIEHGINLSLTLFCS